MLCVAMPEAGGTQSLSVVVNYHRAEHDFIPSVHVHIGHAEVVVTLPEPRTSHAAYPIPTFRQLMRSRVYVESIKLVTRVATASDENGRMPTVQIRRTEIVFGGTMPRTVAPSGRPVRLARFQPFARVRHPFLAVFPDFVQFACGTLHIEQILVIGHGIFGIVNLTDIMGHIAHFRDRAVRMMDNHIVRPTHQHFGSAVFIPVESYGIELFIGSRLHVRTDINVP